MKRPAVIILGAGVSGLTCAIRLLEAGRSVEVWTRAMPLATTSAVAAACWYPYLVQPADAALRWGGASFVEFSRLAETPGTGVIMRWAKVLFREAVDDPDWQKMIPTFRQATVQELPAGYRAGYVLEIPVIEMPVYLPYLVGRVSRLGGAIRLHEVQSVEEPLAESDVVVNCTGLGSRDLLGDKELFPVRGQIVVVERAGVDELIMDADSAESTYIIPRANDCVLGGTHEDSEDLEPNPATATAIMERCARFEKRLQHPKRLRDVVGIRPCRSSIRLEAERRPSNKLLIHNYGHGGAGVTLSWGCAEEVLRLVKSRS